MATAGPCEWKWPAPDGGTYAQGGPGVPKRHQRNCRTPRMHPGEADPARTPLRPIATEVGVSETSHVAIAASCCVEAM